MKVISFILAIYVLALAVTPCIYQDVISSACVSEHCGEDQGCGEKEPCSPFCLHSYVHAIEVSFINTKFANPITDDGSKPTRSFVEQMYSDYTVSFWQPPKI